MTTTRTAAPLIGKCGSGHVVRGENRGGEIVATTAGARSHLNSWLVCPCGKIAKPQYMTVTHSDTRHCDARCEGATGPVCSCSCDGENHGGGRVFAS